MMHENRPSFIPDANQALCLSENAERAQALPVYSSLMLAGMRKKIARDRYRHLPPEAVDVEPGTTLMERHPDWPSVKVSFLFSSHDNAKDLEKVPAMLEGAHIYFPENYRGFAYLEGAPMHVRDLQRLSHNKFPDPTLDDLLDRTVDWDEEGNPLTMRGTSTEPVLRGVYKSGLAIGSIDTSQEEAVAIGMGALFAPFDFQGKSFDEAMTMYGEYVKRLSDVNTRREAIIMGRFESEMQRLFDRYAVLYEKDELKVVISLGAYHTRLYHEFKKNGIQTERVFGDCPGDSTYRYASLHQAQRIIARGGEPSRELLEKIYIEGQIYSLFNYPNVQSELLSACAIDIASTFNSREIGYLFSRVDQNISHDEFTEDINFLLNDKGQPRFPASIDELKQRVEWRSRQARLRPSRHKRIAR